MTDNLSRGRKMTATIQEFTDLMRRAAEPASPGELVTHAINRAARRLGISRRTARAYWYGERATVPADLMDAARRLAAQPLVTEARNERKKLDEIITRIARLEAAMGVSDADFHGPQVDALRALARGADRTVD